MSHIEVGNVINTTKAFYSDDASELMLPKNMETPRIGEILRLDYHNEGAMYRITEIEREIRRFDSRTASEMIYIYGERVLE